MSAQCDPLNTSLARSSSTCRRLRRTLSSAPRSTIARRTPSRDRRARHSATSTMPRGRRFKAPRVRQTSSPSGTTGARKLPLAATAARQAKLHIVAGRASAQVGRTLYRPSSTAQPRGHLTQEHFNSNTGIHWRIFYKSVWKTSAYHQEEIMYKILSLTSDSEHRN